MQFIQAIILGLVQGLTEFIPISSSAHLVIVPWIFGWDDPLFRSLGFDVALHLGTLTALVVFFWKDWVRLVGAWFMSIAQRKVGKDPDRRMAWFILVACIPGAIAGLLFESRIEKLFHPEGSPLLPASMIAMAAIIAALGGLLFAADRFAKRGRAMGAMGWKDAIIIGFSQALAIFPGVSRSGATITAGLALGLERESAARFSFLLSAPIIAGAGAKSLYDFAKGLGGSAAMSSEWGLIALGFVVAAASGFFCIKFLLDFLQRHTARSFVYYRWALALLVVVAAALRMPYPIDSFTDDPPYHLLRVQRLLTAPVVPTDPDPLTAWPHGDVTCWPWGFDWLVAGLVRPLLDAAPSPQDVARACAPIPPLLGALLVPLVFLLGRRLRWAWRAVAAAELAALGIVAHAETQQLRDGWPDEPGRGLEDGH